MSFLCHKRSIVLLPSLLALSSPSRWDSCRACSQRDGEGKHSDGGRYEKWLSVWPVSAGLLVSSALLVAKAVRVFLTTTDSKRSDYSSKRRLLGNVDVFSGIKTVSTTIKPWNVALLWGICKTEAPVTHAPFSPCAPFFFFFQLGKAPFVCDLSTCLHVGYKTARKRKDEKKKMCREQKKPKACIASDEEFEKETKPVSIIHAEEKKKTKNVGLDFSGLVRVHKVYQWTHRWSQIRTGELLFTVGSAFSLSWILLYFFYKDKKPQSHGHRKRLLCSGSFKQGREKKGTFSSRHTI